MLDAIYVLVQIFLFVASAYALRMFLSGQGKYVGRSD